MCSTAAASQNYMQKTDPQYSSKLIKHRKSSFFQYEFRVCNRNLSSLDAVLTVFMAICQIMFLHSEKSTKSLESVGNWLPPFHLEDDICGKLLPHECPIAISACNFLHLLLTCLWQPSTMTSFCWGDVRAKTISEWLHKISSSCCKLISFSSIPLTTAAVASL